MDSRRLSSVDEEAKIKMKHQILLQEYLVLQKECVSKKRKVKEAKERKETVMDEIRFLKRRCNFLLKIQSHNSEQHTVQSQKPDSKYDAGTSGRYYNAGVPASENSRPIAIGSMWNPGSSVGKEEVAFPPLRIGKKPKDLYPNGKRAEKRKISWQDPVALKV